MEEQRQKRQEDLDKTFNEAQEKATLQLNNYKHECEEQAKSYMQEVEDIRETSNQQMQQYLTLMDNAKKLYDSVLEPIKQYEKEKQDRLFYTIQLPEEYQEDIEFLLTTVAAKVQHPDIISKLVWTEYVKPNLDNTFKRIEIKPESGIYKLTSLENGMAYIGKSTDVKKRIADHFKSSIGIRSIADQAVHHRIHRRQRTRGSGSDRKYQRRPEGRVPL